MPCFQAWVPFHFRITISSPKIQTLDHENKVELRWYFPQWGWINEPGGNHPPGLEFPSRSFPNGDI